MSELGVSEVKKKIQLLRDLIRLEEKADSDQINEELSQQSRDKIVADGYLIQKLVVLDVDVRFNGKYQLVLQTSNQQKLDQGKFRNGSVVRLVEHKDLNEIGKGVIHAIQNNAVKLLLDDIPNHLEGLYGLVLDADVVTYKRMHHALNQIEKSIDKGEKTLLNGIFKQADLSMFRLDSFRLDSFEGGGLNATQYSVLENLSKGSALQLIHGPPGTGKTKTLTMCIKALVGAGEKVLVCSGSNHAVDHIAIELLKVNVPVVRMGHPARINEKLYANTLDELVFSTDIGSVLKTMKQELDQLLLGRDKRAKKNEWLSKQDFREERERLMRLKEDLKSYYQNSVSEINKKGFVFCTTNSGAGVRELDKLDFDTVVIDEASQSISASTLIPLIKSKRIILAGDHMQLPPVLFSQEAIAKGLEITYLEELIGLYKGYSTFLNIQYRMAEPIMGFSNQYFYDNRLLTDESVVVKDLKKEPLHDFLKEGSIVFIDTAGADFEEKEDPISFSRYNEKEAEAIVRAYQMILALGVLPEEVGIITPYRGQTECILSRLTSLVAPEVSTVDSFQGREKKIIIISLTRSNQKKDIGFLSETRRMNVAMTRAQEKLIVIGNSETLSGHDFFNQLMEYFSKKDAYASIWEFPELMQP